MSKRDLFIALLRLIGFGSFMTSFTSLVVTAYYLALGERNSFGYQTIDIGLYIILLAVSAWLMMYADKLVRLFRLSKGYDTDFVFLEKLTAVDIVKVGIFSIGFLLLVDNVPYTLTGIYQKFSNSIAGVNATLYNDYSLGIAIIKTVLGYLMITNFTKLSKLFMKWNKEE